MPIVQQVNNPVVRIGTMGSLIVNCYRSTPTLESLDAIERVETELLTRVPKVTSITIAGENASLMRVDEKVRARSVEMAHRFKGRVRGAAIVIATRGLSAVMAHSFMTAYLLLSKQSWPMQTFSTLEAAVKWVEALPEHDVPITVAELEAFGRGD